LEAEKGKNLKLFFASPSLCGIFGKKRALTYWKLKKGTTEDLKIFCFPSFM
jgi:hypothetical protein